MMWSTIQCNTILYNTIEYSAIQCNTMLHTKIQYSIYLQEDSINVLSNMWKLRAGYLIEQVIGV